MFEVCTAWSFKAFYNLHQKFPSTTDGCDIPPTSLSSTFLWYCYDLYPQYPISSFQGPGTKILGCYFVILNSVTSNFSCCRGHWIGQKCKLPNYPSLRLMTNILYTSSKLHSGNMFSTCQISSSIFILLCCVSHHVICITQSAVVIVDFYVEYLVFLRDLLLANSYPLKRIIIPLRVMCSVGW